MEYMTLLGTEQIQSAANTMRSAADQMSGAAGNLDYSLAQHQRFLDDWLYRFQAALEEHALKVASPLLPVVPASLREEDPEAPPTSDKRSYKERRVDNTITIVEERRTITRRGEDEIPF